MLISIYVKYNTLEVKDERCKKFLRRKQGFHTSAFEKGWLLKRLIYQNFK